MYIQQYLLVIWGILFPLVTAQCQQPEPPCRYFYEKLEVVPHETLNRQSGEITFSWDEKKYSGCSVRFVTNDSLLAGKYHTPKFFAEKDTELYRNGWRYNYNYLAEGPGTRTVGIEKGDTLCLIGYAQPATLVEPGKIAWEENITITVECRQKEIK